MPSQPPLTLPTSYTALPFHTLRLSHHLSSLSATKNQILPTPILIINLYRPDAYNAFTDEMMQELEYVFGLVSLDDRVKCVVVTGHGKMFCAGADLRVGLAREEGERVEEHRDGGGRVALAIHRCTKPVIGAIQGAAVGVGITMTLPMTIRIALRTAKIGFVFGRRGLAMEAASSYFLPRIVGFGRALHIVATGATYLASDPVLDGLFTAYGDTPEEVLSEALRIAELIVENVSTVSGYLMREMMWRGGNSAEEAHLLDSRVLAGLRGSADNEEGIRAFMEKRKVNFTGTLAKDAPQVYPWWSPTDVRNRQKVGLPARPPKL